ARAPAAGAALGASHRSLARDGGVGGVRLGDAQLPLALEDLADVLHRGAGIRVGDRDPVDVVLVDGRVLAAEGVVDAAGAAGAEGEVGDEVTLAASSPATAVIAAGGEQSQGRQRAQRRKCPSSDPHRALLFVEVVVTTLVRAP